MAQPLRKIFQKNLLPGADAAARGRPQQGERAPAPERRARRGTLDLSGAATGALGLALVAAVGWSFFMGYLVGRGEHPGRGVESVAGLLGGAAPAKTGDASRAALLPGEEALAGAPARDGAAAPEDNAAPAASRETAQGAPADAAGAAASAANAYPFDRPKGESLAAWGNAPEAKQGEEKGKASAAGGAPGERPRAAPPPAEPRFDYLFQAGAFKGPVDAERLRARLEAAGLRTSVRQSGKVRLVLVSLRGTSQDAQRLRGQLSGMRLGRPIQLEKKPVADKKGGKSRRRSAP